MVSSEKDVWWLSCIDPSQHTTCKFSWELSDIPSTHPVVTELQLSPVNVVVRWLSVARHTGRPMSFNASAVHYDRITFPHFEEKFKSQRQICQDAPKCLALKYFTGSGVVVGAKSMLAAIGGIYTASRLLSMQRTSSTPAFVVTRLTPVNAVYSGRFPFPVDLSRRHIVDLCGGMWNYEQGHFSGANCRAPGLLPSNSSIVLYPNGNFICAGIRPLDPNLPLEMRKLVEFARRISPMYIMPDHPVSRIGTLQIPAPPITGSRKRKILTRKRLQQCRKPASTGDSLQQVAPVLPPGHSSAKRLSRTRRLRIRLEPPRYDTSVPTTDTVR